MQLVSFRWCEVGTVAEGSRLLLGGELGCMLVGALRDLAVCVRGLVIASVCL